MQISLGHGFKVRLGNYEMDDVNVHVTANHRDLGYTDEEWQEFAAEGTLVAFEELRSFVKDRMVEILQVEFTEIEPYIIEPEETFVPLWLEDHEPKKKRGS